MHPLFLSNRDSLHSLHILVLLALAFIMAGCGAAEDSPVTDVSTTGPSACVPGELPLEGGGCQPAGLPPDMPCPPGQMPLEGGGCQPAGLPPDMPCPPGQMPLEGGGCQPAGLPPDMPCPPAETPLEGGGCQPAGVPPDACGQGFAPDGRAGCEPILPASPCPPGQMAVPGEAVCHDVAPCGAGDYGLIPVEATTQFVNGAYPGNDSDGTRAKPWRRIQEGIDHARPGAIVAVAAGSYAEDLLIRSNPVRLWGRCPALVEVVGTGAEIAALRVLYGTASQSEVHSLAITGPSIGIGTSGSSDVVIDRVWIHDTTKRGLDATDQLGPTNITVSGSLIEAANEVGVEVTGADATIEATVVRDTQPRGDGALGRGIDVQNDRAVRRRSSLTLRASLVERNRDIGVSARGSDATIEATVVRDTQPNSDGTMGRGIDVEQDPATRERSTLALRASLVGQNHEVGVFVGGSDAAIETTVVRATQPNGQGTFGYGIAIGKEPTTHERTTMMLRASLLEENHGFGMFIQGSDATIEATVVRDTQPNSDGTMGRGINAQDEPDATTHKRATLTLRTSLLERNHELGMFVQGSDATIETTVVRDTQPNSDGTMGRGITIVDGPATHERASLTLRTSLLEQNRGAGVSVAGSDATIEATVIRATQLGGDGKAGQGIDIGDSSDTNQRATVTLRALLLEQNGDTGVVASGSDVTIEATIARENQGGGLSIQNNPDTTERATLTLRTSLLERNHGIGVFVGGSDATIETTVVRDTRSNVESGDGGDGIELVGVKGDPRRATLTLRASLLEENHGGNMLVQSADATVEATVVRAAQPRGDGGQAFGIGIQNEGITLLGESAAQERATLTLRFSNLERNHDLGVLIFGSDATIEATVIRDTQPRGDGKHGRGIAVEWNPTTRARATLTLRSSLLEQNHELGVFVMNSDATIEETVVRDTQPDGDEREGSGIHVQGEGDERGTLALRASLVEQNHDVGVVILRSEATIDASVVRATRTRGDHTFGDGIALFSGGTPATATITSTRVEANARAGVASFSAAVILVSSTVQCNPIDLDGEDIVEGHPFTFDCTQGNLFGCETPDPICTVRSANLTPPEPISPIRPSP